MQLTAAVIRRCSVKKMFLKFSGKQLCQSLFFNKVAVEFREISMNTFFTEHLRATASITFICIDLYACAYLFQD